MTNEKTVREPLFHIAKRSDIEWWKAWLIRGAAILIVSVLCIGLTCAFAKMPPHKAVMYLFTGNFGDGMAWDTIYAIAILLLISLAVAPAFKMKFWNIGADGQTLVGCLACAICSHYLGGSVAYNFHVCCKRACKRYLGCYPRRFQGKMEHQRNAFHAYDELYSHKLDHVFP